MSNFIDFKRLSYLGDKVRCGKASIEEKDEFLLILYHNKKITEQQYQDYQKKGNSDDLIETGLAIGAILLIGYLLTKAFEDK